jgi:protein-disulfide isomerase/uncharacterized membrane protein
MALAVCGYLLERSLGAIGGGASAAPDVCAILLIGDCDHVLADPRSWFAGLPLAGWGLVHLAALAGLLVLARFVAGTFAGNALLAASALAVAGVGVGLVLAASMVLGRAPLCPLCLAFHVLDLAVLLSLQRLVGRPLGEQLRAVRDGMVRLVRGDHAAETTRWQLVGFMAVALVAAITWQWVYVEAALRRASARPSPTTAQLIAAYRASPERALPVSGEDPHLGPLDAPVHLVVFESFRCTHCRRFAATLASLRRRFGDRLRITFKHYPLSSACNPRLPRDMQPGACELAWAAEAANRQARFWPFHDALLASDVGLTSADLTRLARHSGLDAARFDSDRSSAAVRQRVGDDVALGNRLGLPGTPATFLDGRFVRAMTPDHLEILIRDQLRRSSARPSSGVPTARQWESRPSAARSTMGG